MSADREKRLQEAYQRIYEAGEGLLKVLREPPTWTVVDRVDELVNLRHAALQEAVSLFLPGDQEIFREQLEVLTQQQRVLEAEIHRFVGELEQVSRATALAKSRVRGVRQMMGAGPRGRMLDEKR